MIRTATLFLLIRAVNARIRSAGLWVCVALVGCMFPVSVAGETAPDGAGAPPPGLMWNRSGLPAVFPLQVKTSEGPDYFLTLIDEKTGKAVLAAFVVGGAFFKVLVPPGTFTLRFATGEDWQGEKQQFGPGTQTRRFDLPKPLTFAIRGASTKAGHLVDLRDTVPGSYASAEVRGQYICQATQIEIYRSFGVDLGPEHQDIRRRERSRATDTLPYAVPDDPHFFVSRYILRSRYCE